MKQLTQNKMGNVNGGQRDWCDDYWSVFILFFNGAHFEDWELSGMRELRNLCYN